ncbi:MAG: hemerythrin family protein [Burkholderiaceae bacterium]|nr:hemerythrin family protein [Burkholderiaceae bacterium]
MQTITWAPELATGMAELDELHRAMIDAVRQVEQATDAQFAPAFRDFVAGVENDFRSEEEAMELAHYPDAHIHCAHHARVLSALHHAQSRVMQGDIESGRHALWLLFQWLTIHIETMDRALALACLKLRPANAGAT